MRCSCFALAFAMLALTFVAAFDAPKPVQVSPREVGSQVIILGALGRPIGEKVTVHGVKVRAAKGGQVDFAVDSVDGKRFERPVTIQVDGIQNWPLGTQAEIQGRERGFVDFTDIRKTSFSKDDPRFELRQILYLSFDATEVAYPRTLTIERRNDRKVEE